MNVKLRWPRRKTLRGGHDPRALQALGVEARRRRKEGETRESTGSRLPVSGRPAESRGRASDMGGTHLLLEPHTQAVPAQTQPTVDTRVEDFLAATRAPETEPKPEDDIFPAFPRDPGEPTSDYWLRKALDSQAKWAAKLRADGTLELPREPRIVPNPEQWM